MFMSKEPLPNRGTNVKKDTILFILTYRGAIPYNTYHKHLDKYYVFHQRNSCFLVHKKKLATHLSFDK